MPWLTGVFGLAPGSAADPSDNLEVIIQWHHLELYLRSQSVAGGSLLALLRDKPAAVARHRRTCVGNRTDPYAFRWPAVPQPSIGRS